nr:pyocin knob domain-containing protein [Enterococcus innesii]
MVKQWRNEDIIAPTDAQRWEDGVDKSLKENVQNAGDLKKHAEDKSNPHNVTAAQTGAYSKSEADDKLTTGLARKTNVRGYSNGTVTAANGMDLNDMTESGTFMGSNMLNTPDGTGATSNWWFVTCMVHNNLYQTQIAYFFTGTITQQWQRNNRNGVWQSWKRVANIDDNVASAAKLQTARTINGVAFDGTKNIEIKSEPQVDEIPANSNLNNFKSAGFYGCRLSATAGTISNTPSNVAFSMVVINAGNDSIVTQILSEFNIPAGSRIYIRRCYNNSWGNWFPIATADGTLQSGLFSQSASRLATARTISLSGGVTGSTTFDGSGNATITATLAGNAPSATRLATARKIAGVDFDGTRDIAIPAANVGAYTKVEIDEKFDDISVATRNYLFDTHIERTGRNEFLNDPSWNLAPLIDEYGMDREYTVSFDLKSAIAGTIQVYSQNGSAARYDIGRHSLSATTEYQRFSITFKPEKAGSFDTETRSLLAFFGTYGTGRIPTVRNVMFGLGNAGGDWLPNPDELAKQLALEETDKRIETLEKNTIRLTNQFPDPDFQKREPRPFNEGNFAMTYDANGVVLNNTTATKGRVYWATPPLNLAIGRTYNVAMFVNTDAASWGKEIEVGTGSGENLKFTLTNNSPVWIQGTIKLTTFAAFSIWLEPATVLRIRELHIYEANTDITTARIEQLEKEIERLSKDNSLPPVVPIFASGFSNYNPNPGAPNHCCVERRGDWVELGAQ